MPSLAKLIPDRLLPPCAEQGKGVIGKIGVLIPVSMYEPKNKKEAALCMKCLKSVYRIHDLHRFFKG